MIEAPRSSRWLVAALFLVAISALQARSQASNAPAVRYTISLSNPADHILHVTIDLPPGADKRDLQLPVWNATYQIRDFSQYVNWVRAKNDAGEPLPVRLADKSRWQISQTAGGAEVEYEITANAPGPFGAQLNEHHCFFNLAEVLMYPTDSRSSPVQVRYTHVPQGWQAATALPGNLSAGFTAENYDRLVDSPIEIGAFREADFDQAGGHYRVVVDADAADYDLPKIVSMLQRVVAAETAWMNDRPFDSYLFLYHFPRGAGGGGMEHAYSTAIDVNAKYLADNPGVLADVTAHEFFHLWNVKRIRPQSLEPIDYTQENYTTSLWFSEGVTSTVEDFMLLQSGLLDETHYLDRLSAAIGELESRPAHVTQSAEESSLDAWLEKYSLYNTPGRSISYYNKGELLGTVLDLALRDATRGEKSLRDLFQWMNQYYARQGRYFPDADGIRIAAESISHADFKSFFQTYVAGTDEIPWDDFFRSVGLHLVRLNTQVADPGFSASRNFGEPPVVTLITAASAAEQAGLSVGDSILEINGHMAAADFERWLAQMNPGDMLRVKVRSRHGDRELEWKVGSREQIEFRLKDVEHISTEQSVRRTAWLKGESKQSGAGHP